MKRSIILAACFCLAFSVAASAQWVSCANTSVAAGSVTCTVNAVGVETTNPMRDFVIAGGGSGTFQVSTLGAGVTCCDGFQFQQVGANSHLINEENGFMYFYTHGAQRMTIDNTGRVGIGTTTPGALLDVNGAVNVSGNIAAKYQDVAEWVPSDPDLGSGTVVVLSANKANHVTESKSAYDTKIAGVVSEHPGLILGEPSDGKSKIATTGRVRVKVDATKHPVRIGDLLVTSNTPGYAMYSEPVHLGGVKIHRPGTIIGKALEPLRSGRGEILVLLSLQ
jgi:hypothetical protein